jgi:hypothetical protein
MKRNRKQKSLWVINRKITDRSGSKPLGHRERQNEKPAA